MTLNDCTKAELMFVIERLKLHLFSSGEYCVKRALADVETQREEKRMLEADRLAQLAFQKRKEYLDLLGAYEGTLWSALPEDVIRRADSAMKAAQKADRDWNRLMGFEEMQG